mmetsp:Transcript_20236/g.30017  ORF Transcript_20236/g.30017 Transcript_20236/m.30017 type:complete len:122 (+) Transcript_20236:142-507(+)
MCHLCVSKAAKSAQVVARRFMSTESTSMPKQLMYNSMPRQIPKFPPMPTQEPRFPPMPPQRFDTSKLPPQELIRPESLASSAPAAASSGGSSGMMLAMGCVVVVGGGGAAAYAGLIPGVAI